MKQREWSNKLRRWYASSPALTHALTHKYRTSVGCNSYEYLAQSLDTLDHQNPCVLDLACGGGELYPYCVPKFTNGRWIGIDFVREQVDAARQRFAGIDFRCEDAGSSSLQDSKVDAVLCHLALNEMTPLENVISEIWRVLRSGGIFAAIIQAQQNSSGDWNGDPRAHTREGLLSLFDSRFEKPRVDEYELIVEDNIENLWTLLSQRSYQIGMLAPPEKERKRAETMVQFQSIAKDGVVRILVPGHRLIVKKRSEPRT